MTAQIPAADVAIVGGGLAGLAAANFLAREGLAVTLFEKARAAGGRALTEEQEGFHLNLGPHALFARGRAAEVLAELGVEFRGTKPSTSGGYALDGGRAHTFPIGLVSLLTTGLFGLPAKLETARLLAGLGKIDAGGVAGLSLSEWLAREVQQPEVRRLLRALFRVTTYADEPERQSAGAALAQLRLGFEGVYYLDGGWQTLVDGLRRGAERRGARLVTGARVVALEHDRGDGRVSGVRLSDGTVCPAAAVILAADPATAAALAGTPGAGAWAALAPVRAATLDLALARLPRPRALFALGIDRPLYFSVHSAAARLAPEGGAVLHAMKYLGAEAEGDERELEGVLDLLQPGWRAEVVARRFRPRMVVSHALVTAGQGGMAGRPGPEAPEAPGLYLAGDWIGPEGMLADASLASARRAAELIIRGQPRRAAA